MSNYDEYEYDDTAENVPQVTLDGVIMRTNMDASLMPEPWELDRVQVSFPDAENGYQDNAQETAPLGWVNNAAITLNRSEDSITLSISIGDPRGAFSFTVRRLQDGTLVMHVPYPEDTMLHMPLTRLHAGTYRIGH